MNKLYTILTRQNGTVRTVDNNLSVSNTQLLNKLVPEYLSGLELEQTVEMLIQNILGSSLRDMFLQYDNQNDYRFPFPFNTTTVVDMSNPGDEYVIITTQDSDAFKGTITIDSGIIAINDGSSRQIPYTLVNNHFATKLTDNISLNLNKEVIDEIAFTLNIIPAFNNSLIKTSKRINTKPNHLNIPEYLAEITMEVLRGN